MSTHAAHVGLLGEFVPARLWGPLAAFAAVGATLFLVRGADASLAMFMQLCSASAVAFAVMASLAYWRGMDPTWWWVAPSYVVAATAGGVAYAGMATLHTVTPPGGFSEWMIGAGWSAFFVGLSVGGGVLRARERRSADTQRQLLTARLQLLTAQMEPHFLMNTLANIRALVAADPAAATRMIEQLARFLEGALERSRGERSTLGDEFELVANYLAIMRTRFGDRLKFDLSMDDKCRSAEVPPLLLQTLVENAVTHGIQPLDRPGWVTATAECDEQWVRIIVADDGVGMDPSAAEGIGLRNTRERLQNHYDGRASFGIAARAGGGTVITMVVPHEYQS